MTIKFAASYDHPTEGKIAANATAEAEYKAAMTKLGGSSRAKAIIKKLNDATEVVEILVSDKVGQAAGFIADELLKKQGSTPAINIILWDPSHDFEIATNVRKVEHTRAWNNTTFTKTHATRTSLPPEGVLIHEMGHACQYLGELGDYVLLILSGKAGVDKVEANNLAQNEWPVMKELGHPIRDNYEHYPSKLGTAVQWD